MDINKNDNVETHFHVAQCHRYLVDRAMSARHFSLTAIADLHGQARRQTWAQLSMVVGVLGVYGCLRWLTLPETIMEADHRPL